MARYQVAAIASHHIVLLILVELLEHLRRQDHHSQNDKVVGLKGVTIAPISAHQVCSRHCSGDSLVMPKPMSRRKCDGN